MLAKVEAFKDDSFEETIQTLKDRILYEEHLESNVPKDDEERKRVQRYQEWLESKGGKVNKAKVRWVTR